MTPDELVAHFAAGFDALDAMIAEHPDSADKRYIARRVGAAHDLLHDAQGRAAGSGRITIASPIPKPQ